MWDSFWAGLLMGILLEALCGLVDADKLEQLLRAVICLFFALARMQADNLGYLIADSIDRVEARHGILEDYRDLVAPDFAHFFFAHLFDLMTVEIYRTTDELAGIGGKTHY